MTAPKRKRRRVVVVPRKPGERYPSGNRKRHVVAEETSRDAARTAIEARQRLFGLSEADAAQPEAMTVLGRLKLVKAITPDQHDAGLRYAALRVRYQRAIGAPADHVEPAPDAWDRSGMDYEDWVSATKAQHAAMQEALTNLCVELRDPAPKAALDVFVCRDIDLAELRGALRLALNCLDRHFGGKRK